MPILSRLVEKGVRMFTGVTYIQASEHGLTFSTREGQDVASIEAATIVLAAGSIPNADLLPALKDKVPEIYCIGDCAEPRGIKEAVHEGYHIARKL
jgi:pyruvate/2-oxoglutarate dehydrogenase complex dihydrolipoamide dehydrogenase (E3) component